VGGDRGALVAELEVLGLVGERIQRRSRTTMTIAAIALLQPPS
jgi:hypothetical protein